MNITSIRVSVKGKCSTVPCFIMNGYRVIVKGRIVRIAQLFDDFLDPEGVREPGAIIKELKEHRMADVFSFRGSFGDWVDGRSPGWHDSYQKEYNSLAAIKVDTYEHWWSHAINKKTRRRIAKAKELGIDVCSVPLDERLLSGIVSIFNETPVRQGRGFWHYGKGFDQVKEEISTYADTSIFLGAYFEGELIGFAKLIVCGNFGRANQLLSMIKYRNMPVNNALIAELVRTCESRGIRYLIYGGWVEGSLGEFKQNNGFERLPIPQYYKAINVKGAIALRYGLHKGLKGMLPGRIQDSLRAIRRHVTPYLGTYKKAYKGLISKTPVERLG